MQRHMMAKKAADMYMKQDGERKKAMIMIDQAIEMLGPVTKARGNNHLQQQVDHVRYLVKGLSGRSHDADGDVCGDIINAAVGRLTGKDPYAGKFRQGGNPLLLDGPKVSAV